MKNFNIFFSIFLVSFLLLSCGSNDESDILVDDTISDGVLSFEIRPIANTLGRQSDTSNKDSDCFGSSLKYVRIAIKDSNGICYFGTNELNFHELEMDPLGLDTNNDEILDTWRTHENSKLQLPVGSYTLEYLAVTNNKGVDSEIILMCPRKSEEENVMQYHSLVMNSLPMEFSIRKGEENSLHLETLCFKKEHAYEFGLVFISLDDPNPFYLCSK